MQCGTVIAVHPDGGAALLCTFGREGGCGIRQLGPDGEERGRSELVPGSCRRWVPRPEGGGVLVTTADDDRTLTFTNLDAAGKRGASTSLTSKGAVDPFDARIASDGALIAAIRFTGDLVHRGKRLGKTDYVVSGIVKLAPRLDRLQWSRLFTTRRTSILALLPAATPGGFEAVLQTRGPLVPGGPMNPPIDPKTGNVFGGDTYGWRAERVAFDHRGRPGAREDLGSGEYPPLLDAALVEDRLVTLAEDGGWPRARLTILGSDGTREQRTINISGWATFTETAGRTWFLKCDCAFDRAKGKRAGSWVAHEIGGANAKVMLGDGESIQWFSFAMNETRAVAVGAAEYRDSKIPIRLTALGRVSPEAPSLDVAQLAELDRLGLPAECGGKGLTFSEQRAKLAGLDAPLQACGIPPKTRVDLSLFYDGGIETIAIQGAKDEVLGCARRVLEPAFRCPVLQTSRFAFATGP